MTLDLASKKEIKAILLEFFHSPEGGEYFDKILTEVKQLPEYRARYPTI
jgi:hypothetical protein